MGNDLLEKAEQTEVLRALWLCNPPELRFETSVASAPYQELLFLYLYDNSLHTVPSQALWLSYVFFTKCLI